MLGDRLADLQERLIESADVQAFQWPARIVQILVDHQHGWIAALEDEQGLSLPHGSIMPVAVCGSPSWGAKRGEPRRTQANADGHRRFGYHTSPHSSGCPQFFRPGSA